MTALGMIINVEITDDLNGITILYRKRTHKLVYMNCWAVERI